MAFRIALMGETQPVDVSLWTMQTALMAWSLSADRRSSMACGSAPERQSPCRNSGTRPIRSAMVFQSDAKWPVSNISTWSPGESVLTSAASQAPVPEEGKMTTGCSVWKIVLMPASTRAPSSRKAGPRWSIVGMSIARRIRSGTLVGPGICRKWRPGERAAAWLMAWRPVPGQTSAASRPDRQPNLRRQIMNA